MNEVRGLLRASVKTSGRRLQSIGRVSTLALLAAAAACGSTEPLTGKAPDRSESIDNSTADSGTSAGGKTDKADAGKSTTTAIKDAGKANTTPPKDAGKDDGTCGRSGFTTGAVIPDMLIALDRSGSMGGGRKGLRCDNIGLFDIATQIECSGQGIDCNDPMDKMTTLCGGTVQAGRVDRWTPSVAAVSQLTKQFDTTVSFGLMTFPASSDRCGPGDLKVPIGLGTAAQIASVLKNTSPNGGTPTGETLQAALKLFEENPVGADTVAPLRYVLLVTDGQPTCPNGNGNGNRDTLDADQQFTTDALDKLREAGIKTFVVGYDAALDPAFGDALTEFAQHGGTDHYYPVQDENSLTKAFKSISETVITCAFEFKQDVKDKRLVHVTLDKQTLVPDTEDGWTIEGNTVTVQGASCQKLQGGQGHSVEIVMECEPVLYL